MANQDAGSSPSNSKGSAPGRIAGILALPICFYDTTFAGAAMFVKTV
jgi:hypothetical protein